MLASIERPATSDSIRYEYDELGRVASRSINGVADQGTFDPAGRVSKITNILGAFNYTWDNSSRRLSAVSPISSPRSSAHRQYAYTL